MARLRTLQASFTSGELDPRLAARGDAKVYYSGAARMQNVLVLPMGGFRRRPGHEYVTAITGAAAGWRVLAFAFNTVQTYLMVFVASSIYVFKDDALVATVATSLTGPQVEQMSWAQSADTLIIVHPDVQPLKLVRGASHSAWTLSAITFSNIPTYDFGSGAEAVISVTRGWPSAVTFHQSRLWLGGLKSRPATLLASKVGSFFDLNTGTALDDEAINITIDSDQVNAIFALRSGRNLVIFTSGAEHAIRVDPPITPKNVAISEQTRRGISQYVPPVEVDGALIFVQRGGKAFREFLFDVAQDAYGANILSLLSPHLIVTPGDMAVRKGNSQDDADYVLAVNSDGTVVVLNTLRSQEVNAFTQETTDGLVKHVAVLDGTVYFLVTRTVGGSTVYYLEKWTDAASTDCCLRHTRPAAQSTAASAAQTAFPWTASASVSAVKVRKNGITLDLGTDYTVSGLPGTSGTVTLTSGAAAGDVVKISFPLSSLSGLSHLEGRTVKAIVDGGMQADKTVSSGAVALSPAAETDVEIGLDYALRVAGMPVEGRLPDGTMVGRMARIVNITGRLYQTKSIRINGQLVPFRRLGPAGVGPLDQPITAQTGEFRVDALQGWSRRPAFEITQDAPLPVTVLGLALLVSV